MEEKLVSVGENPYAWFGFLIILAIWWYVGIMIACVIANPEPLTLMTAIPLIFFAFLILGVGTLLYVDETMTTIIRETAEYRFESDIFDWIIFLGILSWLWLYGMGIGWLVEHADARKLLTGMPLIFILTIVFLSGVVSYAEDMLIVEEGDEDE